MRICLVYQGDRLPEERIEKMSRSLAKVGHHLLLLCNDYGGNRPAISTPLRVIRLKPTLGSQKLNHVLKIPLFFNPLWLVQMAAVVRRHRIEVVHVIDLPLSPTALAVGRMFRIPVILDMWENYPEALRIWGQTNWSTRIFKNHRLARAVERYVINRTAHIITVIDEQRDRLLAAGVPPDKVSVVTNAIDPQLFEDGGTRTLLDEEPDCYKLLYVGKLTTERGLDDIIRALPAAQPRVPRLRFYIAGSGNDEPRLRKLAEKCGVGEAVRFLGWVPFQQIAANIRSSDLCVVPHIYCEFINTTIPNKLFQYMALGKPVLVSHAKPLARIVSGCGCGFVFESGNPADASARIVDAYLARDCTEIGARGRARALEAYTWDKVEPELLAIYQRLGRSRTWPSC